MRARSLTSLRRGDDHWVGAFEAMASPCEVLMEVEEQSRAARVLSLVTHEAWRVETKFSRYLPDNVVYAINHSNGREVEIDEETARLLDFANRLHEVSDGRFDITSGVLGRVWCFDGSDRLPKPEAVAEALRLVGWHRVTWDGRRLRLDPGMQIDFGAIGKEYAVDRAAQLVAEATGASCVVKFGGDLMVTRPRRSGTPWRVGIEQTPSSSSPSQRALHLTAGGVATSGDTKRYLLARGVRYGHILDPTTGWPVEGGPASVTVAAGSCVEAGMIATLAMLQGAQAEAFLEAQGVKYWLRGVGHEAVR